MNRLGGAGISGLTRLQDETQSYNALSNEISKEQVKNLHIQLAQFRTALQNFAQTHRDKIRKDASFRHAFTIMCANIGVDPLAGGAPGDGFLGRGWWGELLGLSDWNLELGVQIVDICVSSRHQNGGLIDMADLLGLLGKLRRTSSGSTTVNEEDVVRAIKTLKPLGAGYEVLTVGTRKMVRSVPRELDGDQAAVLSLARETGGRLVERTLAERSGWTRERAHVALENMALRDGLCWIDDQDETDGKSYWVVSVLQWNE